MKFQSGHTGRERQIADLFQSTFAASEGEEEGRLIGALVTDLMATTPGEDLFVFSAHTDEALVGCICFSRLFYADDPHTVFILSPVAVRTDQQRKGIGQRLIAHGLDQLRMRGVDYVTTYGDPDYYSQAGFRRITEDFAQAPLELSQPHGWLGQSLTGRGEVPLAGPSRCVAALNKPELW